MRRIVVIAQLLLSTAVTAAAFAGTVVKEFSRSYDFNGSIVKVKTTNGTVLVQGTKQSRVTVEADIKVRSGSRAEARRCLENIQIVAEQVGDELSIGVEQPSRVGGFLNFLFGSRVDVTVDFSVKVPQLMSVEAAAVNGSVSVVGVHGSVKMSSTNGSLNAEQCRGPIRGGTTNGAVRVDLSELGVHEEVRLRTVNGSMVVVLPPDIGADLRLTTVNGRIRTAVPVEVEGEWSSGSLRGRLHGGGPSIDLETVNGNISLEKP